MRMNLKRHIVGTVLACAVVGLPACGGGGGGTSAPSTPSTPAPATQAKISVTATAPVISGSPRNGFAYRLTLTSTIAETAGLGGNINFVRMRFIAGGAEIEREEISSADLILQTGTNR